MTGSTVLSLSDTSVSYEAGHTVLDNINFELVPGSVTGLLGKNGAGKTTLMRVALGLIKADEGDVRLFGEPAFNATTATRSKIGYVPQAEPPFGWLRVADCLALVGSFYNTWDEALVSRYLDEWEVDSSAYIEDLSTGQKQKVSILLAIGHRPEILLLDEPVASLDPGARRQFLRALVELNRELEHTILFSTHITTDLERVAAEVAVLHNAGVCFRGDLDDLKDKHRRLTITGGSLPDNLVFPGVQHYERDGGHATAFACDWGSEQTLALAQKLGAEVNDTTLPLEELFLELTRG